MVIYMLTITLLYATLNLMLQYTLYTITLLYAALDVMVLYTLTIM